MHIMWLLIPIIAGLTIEALFQVLKITDEFESSPPVQKYVPYNYYIPVTEFMASGRRRWGRYLVFRLLPPFLVFSLMLGIEHRYAMHANEFVSVLIAATISLLPRDILALFRKSYKVLGEQAVYLINIVTVYATALALAVLASIYDFSFIAPTVDGVVDNLWSSLFVVVIVTFYKSVARTPVVEPQREANKLANHVVDRYQVIREQFGAAITLSCHTARCSVPLLYAVLIYEDMNRPGYIRAAERLIVRVFRQPMTIGIAQVIASEPISDEESIRRAAAILADTATLDIRATGDDAQGYAVLIPYLQAYNADPNYPESVIKIMMVLRQYAPQLFV